MISPLTACGLLLCLAIFVVAVGGWMAEEERALEDDDDAGA